MSPSPGSRTIGERIREHAAARPSSAAIVTPGDPDITYAILERELDRVAATLAAQGFGPRSRVALWASPHGPEVAVAAVAIGSAATCISLNPTLSAGEVEETLRRVEVEVVFAVPGSAVVEEAAGRLGLPVLPLDSLSTAPIQHPNPAGPQPDDLALLISTTGTTGKPKFVPFTHERLLQAWHIHGAIGSSPEERGTSTVPLFTAMGLLILFDSLISGTSLVVPRPAQMGDMLSVLADSGVTWHFTSPPNLGALVAAAGMRPEVAERVRLRAVFAGGAALPATTQQALERLFKCHVGTVYGSTESGLVTIVRPGLDEMRPGTVGRAYNCEVAAFDETDRRLSPGEEGELRTRGGGTFEEYLGSAEATAESFAAGWSRTGDLGSVDSDGYVYVSGRVKELINRGGDKIAPQEIDDAVMGHPGVEFAAAFGLPHPSLGEELAVAVIRRDETLNAVALRDYLGSRLPERKIPRRILFVPDVPRTPSGKVLRVGMAERLGLGGARTLPTEDQAARSMPEKRLSELWCELLGIPGPIGRDEDWFELGGDSLLATQMLAAIRQRYGVMVDEAVLVESATLSAIAQAIDRAEVPETREALLRMNPNGTRRPLAWVHSMHGNVLGIRSLARALGDDQPVFAIAPRIAGPGTLPFTDLTAMARRYVELLRDAQPHGPYVLGGYSSGGAIAFEMGRQLRQAGEEVALLIMADTYPPQTRSLAGRAMLKLRGGNWDLQPTDLSSATAFALREYVPGRFDGRAVYFLASHGDDDGRVGLWRRFVADLQVEELPGDHGSVFEGDSIRALADRVRHHLSRAANLSAPGAESN